MTEYAVIDGQRVELTEWFSNVDPVRPGLYQAGSGRNNWNRWYRWFDGTNWYSGGSSPSAAAKIYKVRPVRTVTERWRGLSHPPGAT